MKNIESGGYQPGQEAEKPLISERAEDASESSGEVDLVKIKQDLIEDIKNGASGISWPEFQKNYLLPEMRDDPEIRSLVKQLLINYLNGLVEHPVVYATIRDNIKLCISALFSDPSELGHDKEIQRIARELLMATESAGVVGQFADLAKTVVFPEDFIRETCDDPTLRKRIIKGLSTTVAQRYTIELYPKPDTPVHLVANEILDSLHLPKKILETPEIIEEAMGSLLTLLKRGDAVWQAELLVGAFPDIKPFQNPQVEAAILEGISNAKDTDTVSRYLPFATKLFPSFQENALALTAIFEGIHKAKYPDMINGYLAFASKLAPSVRENVLASKDGRENAVGLVVRGLESGEAAKAAAVLSYFNENEALIQDERIEQAVAKGLETCRTITDRVKFAELISRHFPRIAEFARPYIEADLSPEIESVVMKKIQDIDTDGTAYSTIGAYARDLNTTKLTSNAPAEGAREEVFRSVMASGLLGFVRQEQQGGSDISLGDDFKKIWAERMRDKKSMDAPLNVYFNIIGTEEEKMKKGVSRMSQSNWAGKEDSISIIFNLRPFKKKSREEFDKGPKQKTYLSSSMNVDDKVDTAYGHLLHSRVPPKNFLGVVLGDHFSEMRRRRSFDYREMTDEEAAATRFLSDIVINKRVRRLVDAMKDACVGKPEMLVPVYDIHGNLLWPKRLAHEEVKKMAGS